MMAVDFEQLSCPVERCHTPIVVEAGSLPRERLVAFTDHAQVTHKLSPADAWAFGVLAEPVGAAQVYEQALSGRVAGF